MADQDHQEVVVEATTEETKVVSKGTKNLVSTPKIEGTKTILKQDPKTNKQQLLTKGATIIKIMKDQTLPDNKAEQANGVLIVAKLHTIQLNVGATKRKLSTTSMMKKMNNLKTKKTNPSVTLFTHSSKQKTKN